MKLISIVKCFKSLLGSTWQMAIQAREAGSGRPASVQTASAEQLTPLQPFLYNTNIISPEPFSPHCFMIFSHFFIHDTLVTFVTPCCVICGTEDRIPAQRGRSFRRSCSASARMSSTGSLTSQWPWTGTLISRKDHLDLITHRQDLLPIFCYYLNHL